jgi:zona occludens toxin
MVAELWKHKNRYYIIHNIVGFKTEKLGDYGFNWVDYCAQNNITVEEFFSKDYQIELAKKVKEKYKRNMLIIIDEAHEWFDRNVKLLKMWLSYHRHINQQIYLVAHASRNIPQTYRTFVEVEYRAKSSTFLFLPGYFFYNRIIGGQRAGFIFERKKQSIFALYKSQDISISDKEVKKKSFVIPGIVVVIVLLFMAFLKAPSWIMGKEAGEAKKAPQDSNEAVLGADSGAPASDNIKEAENDMPFDEKYAFVGQISGMVIIEDRKDGVQYMLHRVPGNFRVLDVKRADYCIVWNGRDKIYTLRNFDRYVGHNDLQQVNITPSAGQEVLPQSTYLPGVDG